MAGFAAKTFAQSPTLQATFINPTSGATNVNLTEPFTWTSVPDVQAYYLYVGTTQGAKDLVNTGEIQQTSYRVPLTLATGVTMYARLWTKVGGIWRYVDAAFVAPPIARFIYPGVSTTLVDPTQPLTWTAVPNVQAYYLYIGSTIGAKDLVNTGEMLQTSYVIKSILPDNQTLYARLWTKAGGVWRYIDRTFSVTAVVARFISPAVTTTTVDSAQPLTWTAVPGVQAYYLYVGYTLGAKDIVNTGEIQQTSYLITSVVPDYLTLYARLWTKTGGVWRYIDRTFSMTSVVARFIYLSATVDLTQPLTWTAVPGAQAYRLSVGSTLGGQDIGGTGETLATQYYFSYSQGLRPADQRLFARLWTKMAGVWRYVDATFTTPLTTPLRFIYPAAGVTAADLSQPFQWEPVVNAQAYYLYVGTAVGGNNLVNTYEIQATSYRAANLPLNRQLYARLWVKMATGWSYIDRFITAVASATTTIGFDGLIADGSRVTTYADSGFTISAASGEWLAPTFYGDFNRFPFIRAAAGTTVAGEVRISGGGAMFSFDSVDLYSSTTQIPFTMKGLLNGSTVFTFKGTVPNTFGNFATIANPNTAAVIDTLSIVLTNPAAPCCSNPMGLDNIVVMR